MAENATTQPGSAATRAEDAKQTPKGHVPPNTHAQPPQHLSEDEPDLDRVDADSADSFPASDPPPYR